MIRRHGLPFLPLSYGGFGDGEICLSLDEAMRFR